MLEATSATLTAGGRNGYSYGSSYEVDRYPADLSAAHAAAPIRPDRLTVWPSENNSFGIDVRWYGGGGAAPPERSWLSRHRRQLDRRPELGVDGRPDPRRRGRLRDRQLHLVNDRTC